MGPITRAERERISPWITQEKGHELKERESKEHEVQETSKEDDNNESKDLLREETTDYPSASKLAVIMAGLCFGSLLIALDTTIIATPIPKIVEEFSSINDVGWYGSAYLLTVTAFQPSYGKIYKHFSAKWTFLAAIAIFESMYYPRVLNRSLLMTEGRKVGSIVCAVAHNSPTFIVGRAVAGLGAAGVLQGALCIVGLCVPLRKKPIYMSIVMGVFGLSSVFGPLLGGVITDHWSWRGCFWINLPPGGVTVASIILFFNVTEDATEKTIPLKRKLKALDFPGAVLLISAVVCLLFSLLWGGNEYPWNAPKIIGLFVGFGIIGCIFAVQQWYAGEDATIPYRVLGYRSVWSGAGFNFFTYMTMYINSYYLPFYFQGVQGTSATTSGIRYIPFCVSQLVAIILTGAVVSAVGFYWIFLIVGTILYIIGQALMSTFEVDSTALKWAGYQVLAGFGSGVGIQIPLTAVQVTLSKHDVTIGNAILVFFGQLGGSLGVSLGQTIFNNQLGVELPRHTTEITAEMVRNVGPAGIRMLAEPGPLLEGVIAAFCVAVMRTFILPIACNIAALIFGAFIERRSVKEGEKIAMGAA